MEFAKYEALGNDFIVVDARSAAELPNSRAVVRLCDRRRGIGADGVIVLRRASAEVADCSMEIVNADGSIAEMCGNGLRCVVRLLSVRTGRSAFAVDTRAGIRRGFVETDGTVRVELGRVRLHADDAEIAVDDRVYSGVRASVGNPHFVLRPFPSDVDLRELARTLGPRLESAFPGGVNVSFARSRGDGAIEAVIFERGAGPTLACGTGAAATAVAFSAWGLVPDAECVTVHLPGGPLSVRFVDALTCDARGERMRAVEIAGDAHCVFEGRVSLRSDEVEACP